MSEDPKLISSRHNGNFTRDGVTVELCIYRLANTRWTLEVVDADGTSTVWDDEFETDDDAHAEFLRSIEEFGMLEFHPVVSNKAN